MLQRRELENEGFVMRSAPVTMASYNRCDGPCFPGFCKVVDGFGVSKLLSEVQKGDEITSPDGSVAVVQYVLKTMCPRGYAKCVKIGNLHATPYHSSKIER